MKSNSFHLGANKWLWSVILRSFPRLLRIGILKSS
jgi:hypothetical protein